MARINLTNGSLFGDIRAAINTMFTEVYAALVLKVAKGIPFNAVTGVATPGTPFSPFSPTSSTAPPNDFSTLVCTTAGTLPTAIDGITSLALNDSLTFSAALGVWTKNVAGGSYLGVFVSTAALQTAYPAAANTGCRAQVGSGTPYTTYISDGAAWSLVGGGGSSTLAGATDVASYDLATNNTSVAAVKATANAAGSAAAAALPAAQKNAANGVAPLNASSVVPPANLALATGTIGSGGKTFAAADDGQSFEVTAACTLIFPVSMGWRLGVTIKLPSANVTFIGDGTSTVNDVTTGSVRTKAVGQRSVAVTPGATANAFDLSGQ